MVSIDDIKKLRDETGVSPVEIKKALAESGGDLAKAKELLRIWGKKISDKKVARETSQGIVDFYLHPNAKTGVLIDIRCETDFVAASPEFKKLAHEISLLAQPWIKDDSKTIKNLIEDTVAKVGENIEVKRFARYEI